MYQPQTSVSNKLDKPVTLTLTFWPQGQCMLRDSHRVYAYRHWCW